ncbi:MFS transporter [Brevundimonas vesicularis]|uniref:MFS transporter n=1 Tax=Brevundimonas vesicularis TaxID=41276 RepID=UPI0038D48FEA
MNLHSTASTDDVTPEAAKQTRRQSARAWYIVILLTILYGLSFTDRLILALVAQPVASALSLSDGQLALLLGAGFAVVYAIGGVPIADRIDRGNRMVIIAVGVALWSLMTALSAFATNFWMLLAFRAGVALGEAVLTPAAVSLIGDLFPPNKRAAPTAIYGSMGSIMSTGAFILGGAVVAFSGTIDQQVGLAVWQLTFIILGMPGLFLAALVLFTTRDPRRDGPTATAKASTVKFGSMARYVGENWTFYLPFYVGLALITIVSMGTISWMPTVVFRNFGLPVAEAGYRLGGVGMTAGVLSAIFWPWLVTRIARRGRADGTLIGLFASGVIATITLVLGLMQNDVNLVLAGFFFAMIGLASVGVLAPLALQSYGPRPVRARLTSLYILATGLFGYAVGPLTVVALSDLWGQGEAALGHGVMINAAIAGTLSSLSFVACILAARRMSTDVG